MNGLTKDVERFIGEQLYVEPIYGWGWHDGSGKPTTMPPPFHARLLWLWPFRGELRGGVCGIEQPGHGYNGQCLILRHTTKRNMT